MAGFELVRIGTVAEATREWHVGRYIPLYLAGIVGGVALGIGLTHMGSSEAATRPYVAPAAVSAQGSDAPASAPAFVVASGPDVTNYYVPQLPAGFMDHAAPIVAAVPVAAVPVVKTAASAPALPLAQAPAAPAAPAAAAPAPSGRPNFYVPAVSSAGPSALEMQLLDGINVERANAGMAPYTFDSGLSKIARTRVQQMADQDYFSHVDPFGYSMYVELLAYFGYDSYAWAGENLAMNNYASSEAASRAMVSLMNSPTHKANILAGDFSRVGIGEIDTADGRHIFAMIFLG